MKRIGITGGIGSGKSYVCQRIHDLLNIPIYDCDSRAKALMQTDVDIINGLKAMVGDNVYNQDGTLNKPRLATYIFGNKEHREGVNNLVHPRLLKHFEQWAEMQRGEAVILESAILYSSQFDKAMDRVIEVTAPMEVRIRRVMERDHCSPEQVKSRIESQNEENGLPHFCIVNDGKESIDNQINAIWEQIKNEEV